MLSSLLHRPFLGVVEAWVAEVFQLGVEAEVVELLKQK